MLRLQAEPFSRLLYGSSLRLSSGLSISVSVVPSPPCISRFCVLRSTVHAVLRHTTTPTPGTSLSLPAMSLRAAPSCALHLLPAPWPPQGTSIRQRLLGPTSPLRLPPTTACCMTVSTGTMATAFCTHFATPLALLAPICVGCACERSTMPFSLIYSISLGMMLFLRRRHCSTFCCQSRRRSRT